MAERDLSVAVEQAVLAWWEAWEHKDVARLSEMAREDYLEFAGQGSRRTEGRDALLDVARRFFDAATITGWSVSELRVRGESSVAVCSYRWSERGSRGPEPFELQGMALDVLRWEDGAWRYQAHHVSVISSPQWEAVALVRTWLLRAGFTLSKHPSLEIDSEAKRMALELIEEEVAELRAALAASDVVEFADAIADLLWVVLEASLVFGIPIEPVFREVNRSNLTKLEGERTVNAAGKLVGGPAYSPPDLLPILGAHAPDTEAVSAWRELHEKNAPIHDKPSSSG